MNYRMISRVLGLILMCLGGFLLIPMIAGLCYGESCRAFLISIAVSVAAGGILMLFKPSSHRLYTKDGFVIVGLGWILLSLFGALPFFLSGDIPSYVDAVFETASGFTTTGSTILTDVEGLSRGCMFWRLFTHWIGGMGFLVFIMAVLPMSGEHSMHIMRAEVPGPVVGKLVPRAKTTARILYLIYFAMTMLETVLLLLGGMSFYDALLHSFATAGTGGFSTRAASIGAFNSVYIDMVVAVFMMLFSVNFNLYYLILLGRVRDVLKNEELLVFFSMVAAATVAIGLNISPLYGGFIPALRYSFFNVLTVTSTSGFGNADFTQWPVFSQSVIVLLMIIGACAGSTGGGMKLSRLIILFKKIKADFMQIIRPRQINAVRMDGRRVDSSTVNAVYLFVSLYALLALAVTLLLSVDGYDLTTNFTAAISCLSNVGPGLGLVGPSGNFAIFSGFSKVLLTLTMLTGRLELYAILCLFVPRFWKA